MRKTVAEYVIDTDRNISKKNWNSFDVAKGLDSIVYYATLNNRAPKLGDFVPCDEEGNVLEKPDASNYSIIELDEGVFESDKREYKQALDRVIFKGDWKVASYIGKDPLITNGKHSFLWKNGICNHFNKGCLGIYRIEDLPREIEFKDGVI